MIDKELREAELGKVDLIEVYPKLVVCYEFFRYLRGEFFYNSRPAGLECQKELYKLEKQLFKRIKKLREKIDLKDERTVYYLNMSKKMFD
ncbi:MAG: hypothetical protein ABIK90_07365 [candidate division WOR-3 bacterium]